MKIEEIFGTFPLLETERLLLKKVTLEDVKDIFYYGSNTEVSKYVTWEPHKTVSDAEAFIEFALLFSPHYPNPLIFSGFFFVSYIKNKAPNQK